MPNYSLSQIKAHPDFPFPDFQTNSLAFLMVELYWAQLFEETVGVSTHAWKPTRKPERDGNPIFCVTSLPLKRRFTVIHKTNTNNKPSYPQQSGAGTYYGLQAWTDHTFLNDGQTPLEGLVLAADLQPTTERLVLDFIMQFCIKLDTMDEMERSIAAYENMVKMPDE